MLDAPAKILNSSEERLNSLLKILRFLPFIENEDAKKWAREYEAKVEKGLFEDLSHANSISLKELLQQYCNEVSSTKRGFAEGK